MRLRSNEVDAIFRIVLRKLKESTRKFDELKESELDALGINAEADNIMLLRYDRILELKKKNAELEALIKSEVSAFNNEFENEELAKAVSIGSYYESSFTEGNRESTMRKVKTYLAASAGLLKSYKDDFVFKLVEENIILSKTIPADGMDSFINQLAEKIKNWR